MATSKLTPKCLYELLDYDPATGFFTWRVTRGRSAKAGQKAGFIDNKGYSIIRIQGRSYKAHRLAWFYVSGRWPKNQTDHINGIRTDNRFSNLREATHSINAQNQHQAQRTNKSSKLLGAYHSGKKWKCQIQHNGRIKHLGSFTTAEEAHAAYLAAKRKLHPGCTI